MDEGIFIENGINEYFWFDSSWFKLQGSSSKSSFSAMESICFISGVELTDHLTQPLPV